MSAPQSCGKSASLPARIPWFWKRGTIRDSSLHPDPLGKTNFFVLSEKYLGTRDLRQVNTEVGVFPPRLKLYRHCGGRNMAEGRNLCSPAERLSEAPQGPLCQKSRDFAADVKPWHKDRGRALGSAAGAMGFSNSTSSSQPAVLLDLLHTMRKYHDEPWLLHHVVTHMLVLAGHHHNGLLAGDALGHVVLIVAPVHLSCL